MLPKPIPFDAPVRVKVEDQAATWQYLVQTREAAARFARLTRAILFEDGRRPDDDHHNLGLLAARLVCLDGVSVTDLRQITQCGSTPYRCGEHVALEWRQSIDGHLERRFLHPLTAAVWPRISMVDSPEVPGISPQGTSRETAESKAGTAQLAAPGDLISALQGWVEGVSGYTFGRSVWEQVQRDQMAWWCEHLPGPLFAHCVGAFPLRAIERSAWARLNTRLALHRKEVQDEQQDASNHDAEPQTDQLLDQLDSTEGADFDQSELNAALHILKSTHASAIDGLTKRQWIDGLGRLSLATRALNPATVVLVGWVCHMCEAGTVNTANPAASTIRLYASSVLLPLGKGFAGQSDAPEDWEATQLLAIYQAVLQEKSDGSRPAALAALASFHEYLRDTFDVEPLSGQPSRSPRPKSQDMGTDFAEMGHGAGPEGQSIPPVAGLDAAEIATASRGTANVLWPHEIDWCIETCAQAADPRVGRIARVMYFIARECAVRHQDLSRLAVQNVAFFNDARGRYCRLEVVRHAGRGRLKTLASQRRLIVRSPDALKEIEHWLAQRKLETGSGKAHLFGEANSDKSRYRPAAVHAFLNRLLKIVSGDKRVRLHDLRHTVVSDQVAQALMSSACVDVNLLELIACDAGHASPMTTLRSYTHLYEQPLRFRLDFALQDAISASSHDMARSINEVIASAASTGCDPKPCINGNSLIQSARRRGVDSPYRCNATLPHLWATRLHEACHRLPIESVQAPFDWEAPRPPRASTRVPNKTPVHVLLDAIDRMRRAEPTEAIARVVGIEPEHMAQLARHIEAWTCALYRRQFPRKSLRHDDAPSFAECLRLMRIAPEQASAPLWHPLSTALQGGIPPEFMHEVIAYWERSTPGTYLELSERTNPRALIALLKTAGLSRGHARVACQRRKTAPVSAADGMSHESRTSQPADVASNSTRDMTYVQRLFQQEMEINPMIEESAWRHDRHDVYLRINPHPKTTRTAPSAEATSSLRAWLLAIKARLILDELDKPSSP